MFSFAELLLVFQEYGFGRAGCRTAVEAAGGDVVDSCHTATTK